MKFTVGLIMVGIAISSCANTYHSIKDGVNTDINVDTKVHQLSGVIYYSSFYQGGGAPGEENTTITPYGNVELLIVLVGDTSKKPKVISKIVTDNEGKFETELPNGDYGFINTEDKKTLSKGQCLPTQTVSTSVHESTSIKWEIKPSCPIQIMNKDMNGIVLIAHNHTTCYDCP